MLKHSLFISLSIWKYGKIKQGILDFSMIGILFQLADILAVRLFR